ncbi:hypothetical protein ACFOZ5_14515, partial [Marinobacter lacisalsi]
LISEPGDFVGRAKLGTEAGITKVFIEYAKPVLTEGALNWHGSNGFPAVSVHTFLGSGLEVALKFAFLGLAKGIYHLVSPVR